MPAKGTGKYQLSLRRRNKKKETEPPATDSEATEGQTEGAPPAPKKQPSKPKGTLRADQWMARLRLRLQNHRKSKIHRRRLCPPTTTMTRMRKMQKFSSPNLNRKRKLYPLKRLGPRTRVSIWSSWKSCSCLTSWRKCQPCGLLFLTICTLGKEEKHPLLEELAKLFNLNGE